MGNVIALGNQFCTPRLWNQGKACSASSCLPSDSARLGFGIKAKQLNTLVPAAARNRCGDSPQPLGHLATSETESALAPVGYGKLRTRDFFRPAVIWRRRTRRAGLLWQRVSPARQRSRGARSRVRLCTWPGSPAGVALVTFVPAPAFAHVPRRVR